MYTAISAIEYSLIVINCKSTNYSFRKCKLVCTKKIPFASL